MGSTVSFSQRAPENSEKTLSIFFTNDNLKKTQAQCLRRGSLRKSLTKYVKDGAWVDQLAEAFFVRPLSSMDKAREQHGYVITEEFTLTLLTNLDPNISPSTVNHSISIRTIEDCQIVSSCYISMETLRLLLFSAICDPFNDNMNKYWWNTPKTTSRAISKEMTPPPSPPRTDSPAGILLQAALHFDEEENEVFLSKQWTGDLCHSIQHFPLAISICSAEADEGFPLLYANSTWSQLTERSLEESLGKPIWEILNCSDLLFEGKKDTCSLHEKSSGYALLDGALRDAASIQVGLPCKRRSGSYFDLLGVAPVIRETGRRVGNNKAEPDYKCVVMVHLEAIQGEKGKVVSVAEEQLVIARSMLMMLPLVVKY